MRQKIRKCYICKRAGVSNTESKTMSKIKIAGRYCYVHSDDCLRQAKQIVKIANLYANKFKRLLFQALIKTKN